MVEISGIAITSLPGGEIVQQGIADLAAQRETVAALLVAVGFPRLSRLGIVDAASGQPIVDPELKLYRLLGCVHGLESHSQYNAWIRQLVSFERALEHRLSA